MTGPAARAPIVVRFLALAAVLLTAGLGVLALLAWNAGGGGTARMAALVAAAVLWGVGAAAIAWLLTVRPALARLRNAEADEAEFPELAARLRAAERERELLASLSDAYNRLIIDAQNDAEGRQQERDRLFHDIEAQKADLVAARDAAENEALGRSRFFAAMTHELRTPLTAIMGFSEAIEKQIFGPDRLDKYSEYARDIRVGGEHLLETINHLLDLAKAEAGKFELQESEIDVAGVIEECVSLLRQMAENKKIKLGHVRDITLPPYLADGQIVKQVIINLLSNAIKFTPPGGSVTIQAGVDAADVLFVAVRDTGVGIARDDLKRVFEPFHQGAGNNDRRGTGLGLSLSRVFVELHGGQLRVESVEGRGTTAVVHLPAWRWRRPGAAASASDPGADGAGAETQITRSVAAQSK